MLKHWTLVTVACLALVGCGPEDDESDEPREPAGPVEVQLGEGFAVEELTIDGGWVFVDDAFGGAADIEGMSATRADDGTSDEAKVYLEFWNGEDYAGKVTCMSGGTLSPGATASMTCQTWSGSDRLEGDDAFDSIRVTAN